MPNSNEHKQQTLARIKRTEAYAERVRTLFAATVNELLALNRSVPTLNEGEMFSFDALNENKQREVERLLRQLHSVATMAIEKGIRLEWAQANAECDKLVQSVFGKDALKSPDFTAYVQRNQSAMNAFIARSESGLNLSQRVWNASRQLRDEMEVAITCSVGEGESAASMSRKVRQYLNDPDLMFRRFRYKDADGNWQRKWKKRVKNADGSYSFIDYDKDAYHDQWTGPGYYKSSAQNAMRVARTETNIAYRRADQQRWSQLDFVLGIRIQTSDNAKRGKKRVKDICDKLAGDYPKDFVFDGWHPQCFCYATPILMDDDEMRKQTRAVMRGEKYTPKGKQIKEYPAAFKKWVTDNADKINDAHGNGTDPYFVRNNFAAVQNILNPKKTTTPIEQAALRHAARTTEQEDAIRMAWQERKDRRESERINVQRISERAKSAIEFVSKKFDGMGIDIVPLETAMKSGDVQLIRQQTRVLAVEMIKRRNELKALARTTISDASTFSELNTNALNVAIKSGNAALIKAETLSLKTAIAQQKQAEEALSTLIPNVHDWHQQFTIAELQAVHRAVDSKLSSMPTSLEKRKAALEFEIKWVEDKKKYKTWKVAQSSYTKELAVVQKKIDVKKLTDELAAAFAYAPVSQDASFMQLASEMRALLSVPDVDLAVARAKANIFKTKYNSINKSAVKDAVIENAEHVVRETVDDIIARLGNATPSTLLGLKDVISKWEKKKSYIGSAAQTYSAEIREVMQELFDVHDFGMNIDADVLEKVLTSHFKNTFEVGGGNGYVGSTKTSGKIETSHSRLKAAHEMFGINPNDNLSTGQLKRKAYEKYGNLLDHDIKGSLLNNTATQYGDVEVRFKKSKVIATWTAGDSLGQYYQPSLTSDPHACSFGNSTNVPHKGANTRDLGDFKSNYISRYLELQYHGDLTPDCVESISYPYDITNNYHANDKAIAMKWKAIGVKIYFIDSSGQLKML